MKIILDECTPRLIKRSLPEHQILTLEDVGWRGAKNGDLLLRIPGRFDVLITADKNLRYQHDLSGITYAVVILPSNRVQIVARIIPALRDVLQHIQQGEIVEIPMPI